MNIPLMRRAIVKNPHWRSDPKPWKLYRPHRLRYGQEEGAYATLEEAWEAAGQLAEQDLTVLLAYADEES